MGKKHDWAEIQRLYDSGKSYRDLQKSHGLVSRSFQLARERGDFIPRDRKEAAEIARLKNEVRNEKGEILSKALMRFDWVAIQAAYNDGQSQRELQTSFGVSFSAMNMAKEAGLFSTRSLGEAKAVLIERGWKPTPMSEEARKRMSERASLHYKGGFCKWYEVHGQRVQGTWERDAGLKLTELGIEWRKCGGRDDIIRYTLDGKERSYTPDFYLPACDVYLEFKGYWWGDDKRKMLAVWDQHPDKIIVPIEKAEYMSFINFTE